MGVPSRYIINNFLFFVVLSTALAYSKRVNVYGENYRITKVVLLFFLSFEWLGIFLHTTCLRKRVLEGFFENNILTWRTLVT
jgi:hypothetical protein